MPDYTITLTAAQDLALLLVLERVNADRAQERPPRSALTAAQVVQGLVAQDLFNRMSELQGQTQELADTLRLLTAQQRAAFVAALPDGARTRWLQARLAQGS